MKALRIILFTTLSFFVALYLAFLFVLPYAIDLNQYSPQITQEFEKATGFQVKIQGLKVKTAWNLSGGALIDRTDLKYPTGEKFAQINGLQVKLSLLPLFFGQIKIDSVDLDKIILNLKVEKSGKFLIEQYLTKTSEKTPSSVTRNSLQALEFSPSMPTISAKKYKVAFIDIPTGKIYAVKGVDLNVSDFVLEKKIKIKAIGDLILDGRKQISYDVSVFSKLLPVFEAKKSPEFNLISVFKDLHKYNMRANIKTDLKISGKPDDVDANGNIGLDKVSFTIDGKTLPQSNFKLKFKGDKVKINSNFYTDVDKSASITGVFDNGRNKSIDLRVLSKKTDIGNTFLIANNILQMFGNKNLNGISADGVLNADFKVKSDFKSVQSSGFLKVDNANIKDKLHNVSLKSICADIDFSQNSVHIIKSSAKLGGEPIIVKGTINADANANLLISAENLQIKGLLATLGKMQVLNENDIQSGVINIKASLKGRLDKAMPTIDATLSNVNFKNKPNKSRVTITSAKIKAFPDGKKTKGSVELTSLKIFPSGFKVVALPKASLNFDEKDLLVNNSTLYLNNSKIAIFGKIKDYSTDRSKADITAHGLMYASDIKSMLPKGNQAGVSAVGKIPLLIRVTGNGVYDINAQMLANQNNHLAVFDVDTLRGKTSLINAQLTLNGNDLNIREIGLYALKLNKGLSQNMKSNFASGTKVAFVVGRISDVNSSNPKFNDIGISVPNQLTTSIPGYVGSNVHIKGDLSVEGSLKNPDIKGYLTVPSVYIPTMKTNLRNLTLRFNKNTIHANCPQVLVADSLMDVNAVILNDFSRGIVVRNADFEAVNLNLDSLTSVLSKLPQNANGPGVNAGFTIQSGKGTIGRFKTGNIVATNVSSDFNLKNNLLTFSSIGADSYLGKIGGTVTYNLVYSNIGIHLQGRNMSAGPAIKALTGRPDDIAGQLDFDTNVSMTGYEREQFLRTLKGSTNFIISNGKMGSLGKLEHLLYAQNIVSNSVLGTSLNVIARAVMVKNTGYYKYIKGKMTFSNGWSNLTYIKSSGPSMSMYITGKYNLLNNSANLIILGRISNDVVRILGPLGDLSMDKMLSYIPKIGTITSILINQMTTNPEYENVSMIPFLSPKTEMPTKEFKVILNGGIESQSSVKSFKWLSNPELPAEKLVPKTYPQVGQTVKSIQKNVQEGAKDVWQQVKPMKAPGSFSKSYPNG